MKVRRILEAGLKGAAGVSCGIGAIVVSPLGLGGPIGLIPTVGMAATSIVLIKQAIVEIRGGFDA